MAEKISDLTAKGTALQQTDLLEISESDGQGAFVTKRVTGQNVAGLFNRGGGNVITNTAYGNESLQNNTSGGNNSAIGVNAGQFIANGTTPNTVTNNSVFVGASTKALADNQTNQIVIGHDATGLGSNTTILGNTSTALTALRGNVAIGATADNGFRLNVVGNARVANDFRAQTFSSQQDPTSFITPYNSANGNFTLVATTVSNLSFMRFFTGSPSLQRMTISNTGGVAIGAANPVESAQLDIQSTTRGFLPPRMTNAQRLAIVSPAVGLMVYCTDMIEGLYINKSTGWTFII